MKDEAGTDVFTFSAVGDNEALWGVKMLLQITKYKDYHPEDKGV